MTFHVIEGSSALARLPNNLDCLSEFEMLYALRERTTARLDMLTGILRAAYGLPPSPLERMRAQDAERAAAAQESPVIALPLSGLTGAMLPAAGWGRVSLVVRGGHDA